jgi:hypothetical protein
MIAFKPVAPMSKAAMLSRIPDHHIQTIIHVIRRGLLMIIRRIHVVVITTDLRRLLHHHHILPLPQVGLNLLHHQTVAVSVMVDAVVIVRGQPEVVINN